MKRLTETDLVTLPDLRPPPAPPRKRRDTREIDPVRLLLLLDACRIDTGTEADASAA